MTVVASPELDTSPVRIGKLVAAKVPVTPVARGRPETLANDPDDGVPRAEPLTTNAPALPTFTLSAAGTPVPATNPVETGRPVAFVNVIEDGVPCAPLKVVNAPALPTLTPSAVSTPDPVPVNPLTATALHVLSPRQNVVDDAPVPLLRLVTGRFPVTPPAPPMVRLIAG